MKTGWGYRVREDVLGTKRNYIQIIGGKKETISIFSVSATKMVKNGTKPLSLNESNVNISPGEYWVEEK